MMLLMDYDISIFVGYHTKRIYGFNSPNAVSVEPATGECWVVDKGNDQIVKLSPEGYANSGYTVVEIEGKDYAVGDTEIRLEPSGVGSDT